MAQGSGVGFDSIKCEQASKRVRWSVAQGDDFEVRGGSGSAAKDSVKCRKLIKIRLIEV